MARRKLHKGESGRDWGSKYFQAKGEKVFVGEQVGRDISCKLHRGVGAATLNSLQELLADEGV